MTHSLISLDKLCDNKASQIGIFTNKLDDLDNHTVSFFTHFDFESVSSSTRIADKLTFIKAKA